jgi:hypothetical protein
VVVLSWLRRLWWLVAGLVALAVFAVVVLWWPSSAGRELPPSRAKEYVAFDACLLTGAQGLVDPAVVPVWAGMQAASAAASVKVSYLASPGPATVGNVMPYAMSLLQRHCGAVVAVGDPQVAVTGSLAPNYLNIRFIVIGGGSVSGPNVSVVPGGTPEQVQTSVSHFVQSAVRDSGH